MESLPFSFEKHHISPVDEKFNKEVWFKLFKRQYKIKYDICKQQQPKLIVEVGVRAGYSAQCFLQASPDAIYIGYDYETIRFGNKFTAWAVDLLKPFKAEIRKMDTRLIKHFGLKEVDFVHIDGTHAALAVMHDLDLSFECLSETGLILLDDMCIEDVNKGIRTWIERNEQLINYEYIVSRTGEMLIRKAGNHDKFYKAK